MMQTEYELRKENRRLKRIAVNLKVDINVANERIRRLEKELFDSGRQGRSLELNTAIIEQLEIVEEVNSGSPYDTGTYKSPWAGVRR